MNNKIVYSISVYSLKIKEKYTKIIFLKIDLMFIIIL